MQVSRVEGLCPLAALSRCDGRGKAETDGDAAFGQVRARGLNK